MSGHNLFQGNKNLVPLTQPTFYQKPTVLDRLNPFLTKNQTGQHNPFFFDQKSNRTGQLNPVFDLKSNMTGQLILVFDLKSNRTGQLILVFDTKNKIEQDSANQFLTINQERTALSISTFFFNRTGQRN